MKFLYSFFLFFCIQYSFATTYYISPTGSDKTGNGSILTPWQSLYQATSSVKNVGDIIHVNAGVYTETIRSTLSVGVSIEGEGTASIIKSTLIEEFVAIIIATSPEGTDGNQHISNIKLDGDKRTTSWAIEIRGRKNVSIHDCIIIDFEDRGIVWGGREDNENAEPGIYATGNTFYNNIVTNCAKYDSYGRGCLNVGGQEGMLIYNNTISQTGRAKGTNGWPIKAFNDGYLNGCKIYNNIVTKEAYDGTSWDFAIELFNESGLEIFNNTIIGSVDMNHQTKGAYAYSVYIHDNIIGPTILQSKMETGITMEYETETVIIENNHLKNLGIPIYFTPREVSIISDVTIKNNLCDNVGVADGSHKGYAINFISGGGQNHIITNFFVYNNKFIANIAAAPYYGIGITGAAFATNIKIQNNTIKNFSVAAITANPAFIIDTFLIENNIFSGNGNNNKPFYIGGTPANYTIKNNITSNSASAFGYVLNFKQLILRPLYYDIKRTTMLEFIALVAGIISLLFSCKENIYAYPLGLINIIIFIFLRFDQGFAGDAIFNFCNAIICIYGWKLWSKRNRKKHRIIRITTSTKNEKNIQLVFFSSSFILIFFSLTFFKPYFVTGTIPWADAFIIAAAFTGLWLMAKKKLESWYWWIVTYIVSIPLHFEKHYVFISMYYISMLAIALLGLYKWKKRIIKKRLLTPSPI